MPDDPGADDGRVTGSPGASVDPHGTDPLAADIDAVRSDEAFTSRAGRLLKRDKQLLERLEQ